MVGAHKFAVPCMVVLVLVPKFDIMHNAGQYLRAEARQQMSHLLVKMPASLGFYCVHF